MTRTVELACRLEAPADQVWSALQTSRAFTYVTRGMLRYPAAERIDREWTVGDEIEGWIFLFGFIPFSRHHLRIESIDEDRRVVRTDESGGAIRTWRHRIEVTPIEGQACRYEDRIEIDAGPLTGIVTAYAQLFYRYRQRRWRRFARIVVAP